MTLVRDRAQHDTSWQRAVDRHRDVVTARCIAALRLHAGTRVRLRHRLARGLHNHAGYVLRRWRYLAMWSRLESRVSACVRVRASAFLGGRACGSYPVGGSGYGVWVGVGVGVGVVVWCFFRCGAW